MNTIELKTDLFNLIDEIEDKNVLMAIRILLLTQKSEVEEPDFWDELPSGVIEDINIGLLQADSGNVVSHEEAMDGIRAKYLK